MSKWVADLRRTSPSQSLTGSGKKWREAWVVCQEFGTTPLMAIK